MAEHLKLKWGTLKGWKIEKDSNHELLRRYFEIGSSASAMLQEDTAEQKQIICDLIDGIDGEIENDWSGEEMTKEAAKDYVMNYGRGRSAQAAQ